VLAGAALLIGNGLVDVERDAKAGKPTTAVRLGRAPAWLAHVGAFGAAVVLALVFAPVVPAPDAGGAAARPELRPIWLAGIPLGIVLIVAGAALVAAAPPRVRERGWELEAIGTAALGLGWLAGTAIAAGGGVAT
jgi:4-hydroxybenzoate polyprenyltransferase